MPVAVEGQLSTRFEDRYWTAVVLADAVNLDAELHCRAQLRFIRDQRVTESEPFARIRCAMRDSESHRALVGLEHELERGFTEERKAQGVV